MLNSGPIQSLASEAGPECVHASSSGCRATGGSSADAPRPDGDTASIPAVVFLEETAGPLGVAGLTPLDRLVVALHRAGCSSVTVVSKAGNPTLNLKRATALGVPVRFVTEAPEFDGQILAASDSVLVMADDVRRLIEQGGRLSDNDGNPLPIGVVKDGRGASGLEPALAGLPTIAPNKVARRLADTASAKAAERALWASIKSSADGVVDRAFNRPCGRPLSKLLVRTPVSPNAVSLVSTAIGLIAAWFFALGNYSACVIAAILFQLSAIVDCVDGDIARVAFKESPMGKWIDLVGDQVVHVAVFGGIALGLMNASSDGTALWLGASAVAGALLSFGVILRGMGRAAADPNGRLQKLIDAATNRDFSVLVLFLAVIGRLEWFLWLAAIGSHVFWMTALALQFTPRPTGERAA